MKSILLSLLLITQVVLAIAQETSEAPKKKMHGTFYFTWGYHRDNYSNSDIHFHDHSNPPAGNYDFTIDNMKASDQPDFIGLLTRPISVPQYVFNVGYFFNNKKDLGVELSWDHLKYVMDRNQVANINGYYDGQQVHGPVKITPNFLRFEHTNGHNYLMVNLVKRIKLFDKDRKYHKISLLTKAGTGLLIPKTDSYILGQHQDGPFRISGICFGASVGLRYDFFKYFFIEFAAKGAFADYTNIKLYGAGRAEQTFWSSQLIWSAGLNFPLPNN